ncbi:hypothetical protein F4780DRAFT_415698 [Xylariomycetidae sp. FL0641]|nr:hypothetical protein F4780DRAFT_415698 [Xylariomycetidae sp. FL0641]
MECSGQDTPVEPCLTRTALHIRSGTRDQTADPADIGLENPDACVKACFQQFLAGRELVEVCRSLQQDDDRSLWGLYCCDSSYCGVYTAEVGQSPSVDLIINECQNNGYYSIPDPGPPNQCLNTPGDSLPALPSASGEPQDPGLRTFSIESAPTITSGAGSSLPTTTASQTAAPNSAVPLSPSEGSPNADSGHTASHELTEGAKIAIGVVIPICIIAGIFLAVCLLRRRSLSSRRYPGGNGSFSRHHIRSFSEPPGGSRTPLITRPATAVFRHGARTPPPPPARLGERRYLPSIFRPGGGGEPNTRRSDVAGAAVAAETIAFPTSPLCAPTHSKLVPRHERRVTTSSIGYPMAAVSPPAPYAHSSVYSLTSSVGGGAPASTVTFVSLHNNNNNSSNTNKPGGTPPVSRY